MQIRNSASAQKHPSILFKTGLSLEAGVALAFAAAAIKFLPFAKVAQLASARHAGARRFRFPQAEQVGPQTEQVGMVCWAIRGVSCRVPWRTVCFQKGLATHLMLRRRGVPSILHYGIALRLEEALSAHVWVSVDDQLIMGGREAKNFRCVAEFPGAVIETKIISAS